MGWEQLRPSRPGRRRHLPPPRSQLRRNARRTERAHDEIGDPQAGPVEVVVVEDVRLRLGQLREQRGCAAARMAFRADELRTRSPMKRSR